MVLHETSSDVTNLQVIVAHFYAQIIKFLFTNNETMISQNIHVYEHNS